MTTPYRTPAEVPVYEEPGPENLVAPRFELAKYESGTHPGCPKCSRWAGGHGRVCLGRKSFWGKPKCPSTVTHFHLECDHCHYHWLMATKDGKEGLFA